jgi:HEAT repeat protein
MATGNPDSDPLAPLLAAFRTGAPTQRHDAARELTALGAAAEPAVPDLLTALRDEDLALRPLAAEALAAVGEPAVRPIVEALLEPDPDYRRALLLVLGRLGPAAAVARPVIEAACQDPLLRSLAERVRRQVCPTTRERLEEWLGPWGRRGLVLAAVVVAAVVLAAVVGQGDRLAVVGDPEAMKTAWALALTAAAVGALVGGSRWGVPGAVLGGLACGAAGGYVGYLIAELLNDVVRPLVKALGQF